MIDTLADPHQKFWKALKDTTYFVFVGWPLILALAVVFKEGF